MEKESTRFTPYLRDDALQRKKKILWVAAIGVAALAAAALGFLSLQRSRSGPEVSSPAPRAGNIVTKKVPVETRPTGSALAGKPAGDVPVPRELAEVLDEIQKQIDAGKKGDARPEEAWRDDPSPVIDDHEPEKTSEWIDLFNQCRYSFSIQYQKQGGVDLFVIDTYTGKMRVKTNCIENDPVRLFPPEQTDGQRRFFQVHTAYQLNGADVYVIDSFTSEIATALAGSGTQALEFFASPKKERSSHYSAQINYNSGKIDYFVFDDCSSETRILRGQDKPQSVFLFSEPDKKKKSRPHFFSWFETNSGHLDLYAMDMVNGEVRIQAKMGEEEQAVPFAGAASDHPPRYHGWVGYVSGRIEFWAVDGFTGELRFFSNVENFSRLQPFDNPHYKSAWSRFDVRSLWDNQLCWLYTFDSVTGEFVSDTRESAATPYRHFPNVPYRPPQSRRYDWRLVLQIAGGVDLYVLDTYTSEVRVARSIKEKKSVSLF
jgi:hypothetical protein